MELEEPLLYSVLFLRSTYKLVTDYSADSTFLSHLFIDHAPYCMPLCCREDHDREHAAQFAQMLEEEERAVRERSQ